MRIHILSCVLLLVVNFNAAASDLYAEINRLRAGDGNCVPAGNLPALKPQSALEEVASALSQGDSLRQGLTRIGYRATRSIVLSFKGDLAGEQAAQMLGKQDNCSRLQDPAMTEVGVYRDSRQVWIVLAAPFAPAVAMSVQAAGQRVLALVNQARAVPRHCGDKAFKAARPVMWNELLAEISRRHAEDMARNNYFSHGGRDGSNPAQRVERAGYRYRATGENIAAGVTKPEDAVAGWINSPPHCANLMAPVFTEMGVAFAVDSGSDMGVYWAQAFGTPR